jgi:AsmA protein
MSRGIKILAGVGVVVVAAVVLIPRLISTDAIVAEVTEQVKSVTGRDLTINGGTSLSIFPSLKVELNDVHFANLPQSAHKDMVSMTSLSIHLPWMALFSGKLELEQFVINEPNIRLETDKSGKANWQLFSPAVQSTATDPQSTSALPEGFDLSLGEVAIRNGSITYLDGVTGKTEQITGLNVDVLLPSLYQSVRINGNLVYKNETIALNTELATPAKLIAGETYDINAKIAASMVQLDFGGAIASGGKNITGKLAVTGDSLYKLMKWQDVVLAESSNAYQAFALHAEMELNNDLFSLAKLKAELDALTITGSSQIRLTQIPQITAEFDLGMLDINPYLPPVQDKPEVKPDTPATPIVWDDSPIDLSGLKQLDLQVKVKASGLKARDITLGENQFSVKVKQGVATMTLDKFNAYEGSGVGMVSVNAAKAPYHIKTDFALTNINAAPLLTDVVGFDKVLGKGSVKLALATTGQSQKEWMSGLAGPLSFELKDGGIKGANLAEMVRQAKEMLKGDFSSIKDGLNADFDKDKTTDFSSLSGSFTFNQGVGVNSDLMLASPLLRITGEGQVDLPNTLVDYRLVTGLVDTIEGQNSQDKSTGFKVPVRIKGPFHDVKTKLDVSSQAKEQVKDKAKEKLKDKLKGLFGG